MHCSCFFLDLSTYSAPHGILGSSNSPLPSGQRHEEVKTVYGVSHRTEGPCVPLGLLNECVALLFDSQTNAYIGYICLSKFQFSFTKVCWTACATFKQNRASRDSHSAGTHRALAQGTPVSHGPKERDFRTGEVTSDCTLSTPLSMIPALLLFLWIKESVALSSSIF